MDVLTVLRKELSELLAERHSRRGVMIQTLIMVGVLGILLPSGNPTAWLDGKPGTVLLFMLMPGMLAATVAADGFAGERERKTLETLLAQPLSERAILLGKAACSVMFGLFVALLALGATIATVNLTIHETPFIPSLRQFAGVFGGGFASALLMSGIAVIVSMQIPVARAAQQIVSFSSLLLTGLGVMVWNSLGWSLTWRHVFEAQAVLFALACVVLSVAATLFRRAKFFEKS